MIYGMSCLIMATTAVPQGLLPRPVIESVHMVPDSSRACHCRYTPAIEAINEKLRAYAQLNTRIDFVDCTASFVEDDDRASARVQHCSVMFPALHHMVAWFITHTPLAICSCLSTFVAGVVTQFNAQFVTPCRLRAVSG